MIIGREIVITINGMSKLLIIVIRINFFNLSREIGRVSIHSKIPPEINFIVFNMDIRKKLKNWKIK